MTVDQSPLANYRQSFAAVTARCGSALRIAEIPLHSLLNLRIAPSDAPLWTGELGVALPGEPNTLAHAGDGWVAWLGPDEWLRVSTTDVSGIAERLRAAASHVAAAVVDVSAARATLEIGGHAARRLLAHGCALDLHPRVFPVGRCAQTRIALAEVIIAAPVDRQSNFTDAPTYRVLVGSSFARYLGDWLLDAATTVTSTQ